MKGLKHIQLFLLLTLAGFVCNAKNPIVQNPETIPLEGTWSFSLDTLKTGIDEAWFNKRLTDTIKLPGTTDENKKGRFNARAEWGRLSRVYPYYGPAWYQKEIEVPEQWNGKHIFFVMERTKTSRLWLDDHYVGSQNSLTTAQSYDLTKLLTPGKHLLTVCIDNTNNPPIGDPHQLSDGTQTNWNGILGDIELQIKDPVFMTDVQVYPDVTQKSTTIKIKLNTNCKGNLTISANSWNSKVNHPIAPKKISFETNPNGYFETIISMGDSVQLWDVFSPALYAMKVEFSGQYNRQKVHDQQTVNFGMRNFNTNGTQFQVNGKNIFLRGKHDACVFPLTGYAPMETGEWIRIFRIANFSAHAINGSRLKWSIIDHSKKQIANGEIDADIPQGKLVKLGDINVSLAKIREPQKVNLKIPLDGTNACNNYPIWVYPEKVDNKTPKDITITDRFNDKTVSALMAGSKVLLLPDTSTVKHAIGGAFQTDFWCYPMFKKYSPPGTLGILCNPKHAIFNSFPTEFHSNWQWWPLLRNGLALVLDNTPADFRPLVQVIDNFERNHKLGVIFECKVGKGKLLVYSCNLLNQQDKPEARQLLHSLLEYAGSKNFSPTETLDSGVLKECLQ
jgi:hypothetical protein